MSVEFVFILMQGPSLKVYQDTKNIIWARERERERITRMETDE
jgi:hypothetical protein